MKLDVPQPLNRLRAFAPDDSGSAFAEYGLIAACVALAALATIFGLYEDLATVISGVYTPFGGSPN